VGGVAPVWRCRVEGRLVDLVLGRDKVASDRVKGTSGIPMCLVLIGASVGQFALQSGHPIFDQQPASFRHDGIVQQKTVRILRIGAQRAYFVKRSARA